MLNEQEKFWLGKFGNQYVNRNFKKNRVSNRKYFFKKVLKKQKSIKSILEFGCNQGLNLKALHLANSKNKLSGVDINYNAIKKLNKCGKYKYYFVSATKFTSKNKYDLTFCKGLLIHVNPNQLHQVYKNLYKYSKKFILIAEYYSPQPTKIKYRGHNNKLFKRDFAGEMLKKYKNLKLVDYGFHYHGDKNGEGDDDNWFLLKKK